MTYSWPDLTRTLIDGDELTESEARWAMNTMLAPGFDEPLVASFLTAQQMGEEGLPALTGYLDAFMSHSDPLPAGREVLDIVGTGGDQSGTVNISSMAAVVVAAAGIPVIKHGHRAVSSHSGSSDFFEALGVDLEADPQAVLDAFAEAGIGFAFAPLYHHETEWISPLLRQLGVPTVFDLLRPLSNPARPRMLTVGVAHDDRLELVASLLADRGDTGLVFRGMDGLDELSTTGPNTVWQVSDGQIVEFTLDPDELGLEPADLDDLVGGDAETNADIARSVFAGDEGSVRDIVLLNAAGGMVTADLREHPDLAGDRLADRFADGLEAAAEAIDSGAAEAKLDAWVAALDDAESD
jgi:anthranilate phosphoribosyltransferase